MKKIFIPMAILTFGFIVLMTACSNKTKSITKVYLIDITGEQSFIPDAEQVKQSFHFQEELYNAAHLKIKTIADVHFTETYELELKAGNPMFDIEQDRIVEINKFYKSIDSSIEKLKEKNSGKAYSSVFETVLAELEFLSKQTGELRDLVIFSDLREHNSKISLYDQSTIDQLRIDPEAFKKRLMLNKKIPELEGVSINIYHAPKDFEDASIFEGVARIYKYAFEQNGAVVNIQTLQE